MNCTYRPARGRRTRRLAGLAVLACTAVGRAAAPRPTTPAPPDRLTAEEYADRAGPLLRQPLPDPAEPAEGVLVQLVAPGSPAAVAGLKAGDVVGAVDGRPLTGQNAFRAGRAAATGPAHWDVYSPAAHAVRAITVPAGRLGILTRDRWLMDVEYVRGLAPGERPVDELLVAARASATDADLADSALARARKAGVAGPVADLLAATTAYHDLRMADALTYALAARGKLPDGPERRTADLLVYRTSLATYHWAGAARVARDDPDALEQADVLPPEPGDDLPAALAAADALPPGDRINDPVKAFDALHPVDRTKQMVSLNAEPTEQAGSADYVRTLVDRNGCDFNNASNTYNHLVIGPAGANVDLTIDTRFHQTDDKDSNWPKGMTFALSSQDDSGVMAHDAFRLTMLTKAEGIARITGRGLPGCILNVGQATADDKLFRVHLTAVGGWLRLSINDRRVYYGPVSADLPEADRHLVAGLWPTGLTGNWQTPVWRTADARQPTAVPAPAPPAARGLRPAQAGRSAG